MTDQRWIAGLVYGLALCLPALEASGQVVERREKITGPGGRSAERTVRTERGPGYIDRRIDIERSTGAKLSRETVVRTGPGGRPWGPPPPHRPPVRFGPGPAIGAGLIAAPFLSLSFGSPPPPPPPPPVVIVPEPIYAYPAPPVVVAVPQPQYVAVPEPEPIVIQQPQVVVPAPQPSQPAPPPDPIVDALGRLKSYHANSRRDGSLTLGHLGDNRALPALMERLERDGDRDVRVAAAWALGEIGDPRSAVSLERAALYDKKQEVRTAANDAYRKLPRPGQPAPTTASAPAGTITSTPTEPIDPRNIVDPGPSVSPNQPAEIPDLGPALEAPAGAIRPGRPS